MSNKTIKNPTDLIISGPVVVKEWYRALKNGQIEAPDTWGPLTVAEAASNRARTTLDTEWLATAVEILEDMAKDQPEREREANLISAMHLRGYFMVRLGVQKRDECLDLRILTDWFLSRAGTSLASVKEKASHWQRLDVKEIRALRDIKNRLGVFVELDKSGMLAEYPEIRRWLSLRDLLP